MRSTDKSHDDEDDDVDYVIEEVRSLSLSLTYAHDVDYVIEECLSPFSHTLTAHRTPDALPLTPPPHDSYLSRNVTPQEDEDESPAKRNTSNTSNKSANQGDPSHLFSPYLAPN